MTTQKNPAMSGDSVAGVNDLAGVIVSDSGEIGKEFATLCAQFALQGHQLVRADCGSMYAIRWNMAKHLPDAGAAMRYLRLIGGAQ